MRYYLNNILIALTQFLNTLIGGYPDETTSSRAHRQQFKRRWRIARALIDRLFFWQDEHCKHAYFEELQRRQMPPALRDKAGEANG